MAKADDPLIGLELEDVPGFVCLTIFRPTPTQSVYVLAATDPDSMARVLRPRIGASLCVISNSFTKDDIDRATELESHWKDWGLDSILHSSDEAGQAIVTTSLHVVTRDIAQRLSAIPRGLLRVTPWLTPAEEADL